MAKVKGAGGLPHHDPRHPCLAILGYYSSTDSSVAKIQMSQSLHHKMGIPRSINVDNERQTPLPAAILNKSISLSVRC